MAHFIRYSDYAVGLYSGQERSLCSRHNVQSSSDATVRNIYSMTLPVTSNRHWFLYLPITIFQCYIACCFSVSFRHICRFTVSSDVRFFCFITLPLPSTFHFGSASTSPSGDRFNIRFVFFNRKTLIQSVSLFLSLFLSLSLTHTHTQISVCVRARTRSKNCIMIVINN
jgi:hypothetical protein